jgi:hypothetical protein
MRVPAGKQRDLDHLVQTHDALGQRLSSRRQLLTRRVRSRSCCATRTGGGASNGRTHLRGPKAPAAESLLDAECCVLTLAFSNVAAVLLDGSAATPQLLQSGGGLLTVAPACRVNHGTKSCTSADVLNCCEGFDHSAVPPRRRSIRLPW